MGPIEREWATGLSRRKALAALSGMLAGAPGILSAQLDPRPFQDKRRAPSIAEMVDAFDFEEVTFANVPASVYDYMAGAGGGEWTKRRNRHAFEWVEIVPGSPIPPASVDLRAQLMGTPMVSPIFLSPTASQGPLHPTGESGMYQATTANGSLMVVSQASSTPQDVIAAAANGPRWIQHYPNSNLDASRAVLDSFLEAGAPVIFFTLDQQANVADRPLYNRYLGGEARESTGQGLRPSASETGPRRYGVVAPGRLWYNWDAMEQLRDHAGVPVMIKGTLTAEEAREAVNRGFDGIVVSNHGGRTLEYTPSSLEVLEEVVQEVNGAVPVLIDSGFRRGSDVFKALALGADAVGIGRASRWGLGAFGPAGAQRVLEIMQNELREAMAATGRATVASIDRTAIRTDMP